MNKTELFGDVSFTAGTGFQKVGKNLRTNRFGIIPASCYKYGPVKGPEGPILNADGTQKYGDILQNDLMKREGWVYRMKVSHDLITQAIEKGVLDSDSKKWTPEDLAQEVEFNGTSVKIQDLFDYAMESKLADVKSNFDGSTDGVMINQNKFNLAQLQLSVMENADV